jgi:hypothetical protein
MREAYGRPNLTNKILPAAVEPVNGFLWAALAEVLFLSEELDFCPTIRSN